jgi:hypothetical protein
MIEKAPGPTRFDDELNDYNTESTYSQNKGDLHHTSSEHEPHFSGHR